VFDQKRWTRNVRDWEIHLSIYIHEYAFWIHIFKSNKSMNKVVVYVLALSILLFFGLPNTTLARVQYGSPVSSEYFFLRKQFYIGSLRFRLGCCSNLWRVKFYFYLLVLIPCLAIYIFKSRNIQKEMNLRCLIYFSL